MDSIVRNGIDQYQLEVLEKNIPARKLYEKNGFRIVRRLRCYEKEFLDTSINEKLYEKSYDSSLLRSIDEIDYVSFMPTWQNSLRAFYNKKENYYVIIFLDKDVIIGYGIIHKERGDILQVGVRESHRDTGIEEILIKEMAHGGSKNKVRLLNIEDKSYMQNKLEENQYSNFTNQYEMVYRNNHKSVFS